MDYRIYKKIAKKHGVTVEEVQRDMRLAIDKAYEDPSWFAQCVKFNGEKPTPEELIEHIINRMLTL